MAAVTLTTLRARVRELADMVGSDFVTDTATSLDAFINASADELYGILVDKFEDHAISSYAFSTVAGTGTYALPSDFYKLKGVDYSTSDGEVALEKFTFKERHRWGDEAEQTSVSCYRLEGANLRLRPTPMAVFPATLWYVPLRTQLTTGASTLEGVNGWEEYVVIDAAIRCLLKEESDASALMAMKAAIKQRIEEAATHRDPGAPERMVDVEGLMRPPQGNGTAGGGYGGLY